MDDKKALSKLKSMKGVLEYFKQCLKRDKNFSWKPPKDVVLENQRETLNRAIGTLPEKLQYAFYTEGVEACIDLLEDQFCIMCGEENPTIEIETERGFKLICARCDLKD